MSKSPASQESRRKLLDAALHVMRVKGYAATTVDDICTEARLTKGSFFHHFASKEELGVAAAQHFADMAAGLFGNAPYRQLADPRERLLGYVDFRIALLTGPIWRCSCLLGTFVQELYDTHPAIRAACQTHLAAHVAELEKDIVQAKHRHAPEAAWSPASLAHHMQVVLQGGLIFAKAQQSQQVAVESLQHLRAYLEHLFHSRRTEDDDRDHPASAA